MPATHIFLSHGLESGPDSRKIRSLAVIADQYPGVETVIPDYRGMQQPRQRLEHLLQTMEACKARPKTSILVGSGLGGWVSAAASSRDPVLGCFLMAPALGMNLDPEGYFNPTPVTQARHALLIHGWHDEVVPVIGVLPGATAIVDRRWPS